jgi:hypothetical protein
MFDKLIHLHANLHVWEHVVQETKKLRQAQRELERVMCALMTDENDKRRTELAKRH